MNDEVPRKQWADVKMNGECLVIDTYSGYRSCALDEEGRQHLLAPEAGNAAVGEALMDSLAHSRFLRRDEIDGFFDPEKVSRVYTEWKRNLMERFGYKNKRALFKGMKCCHVEQEKGTILIQPTRHEKLEGWAREKGDDQQDVMIAESSTPDKIGEAVRMALERCVG